MRRRVLHCVAALAGVLAIAEAWRLLVGDESLVKHMVGHVLLVDLAAASIVLAVPTRLRRATSRYIDARAGATTWTAALLAQIVRSPLAMLAVWTITLTMLMAPVGHRWAVDGVGRFAEPIVLLVIGIAFWRVTFDAHTQRPIRLAMFTGGLAWWGRHLLAMVGRVAILPGILALWYWPAGAYGRAGPDQQELAAGVVLGAEMSIFAMAFVLFFALLIVLERGPAAPASPIHGSDPSTSNRHHQGDAT